MAVDAEKCLTESFCAVDFDGDFVVDDFAVDDYFVDDCFVVDDYFVVDLKCELLLAELVRCNRLLS